MLRVSVRKHHEAGDPAAGDFASEAPQHPLAFSYRAPLRAQAATHHECLTYRPQQNVARGYVEAILKALERGESIAMDGGFRIVSIVPPGSANRERTIDILAPGPDERLPRFVEPLKIEGINPSSEASDRKSSPRDFKAALDSGREFEFALKRAPKCLVPEGLHFVLALSGEGEPTHEELSELLYIGTSLLTDHPEAQKYGSLIGINSRAMRKGGTGAGGWHMHLVIFGSEKELEAAYSLVGGR